MNGKHMFSRVSTTKRVAILLLILAIIILGAVQCVSADDNSSTVSKISTANKSGPNNTPPINPYLAAPLYAITHFDSSQSDSTPYGPPKGEFKIDPTTKPLVPGGPINILTLASTDENYMWAVGTNRVAYVKVEGNNLTPVAKCEALADATHDKLAEIPEENLTTFGKMSAVGMNSTSMNETLINLFGANYDSRFKNGFYSVVDNENVLYSDYGGNLFAFALKDPNDPAAGIEKRYEIKDVITAIQGDDHPNGTLLFGLSMTYDGHLIITFSDGIAVIDRNLDVSTASLYRFGETEFLSNSPAVDENSSIYVASDKIMRKLVWTGTKLSGDEADGAWSTPYTYSEQPPVIKIGVGTGSTPTLMGFGNASDKLVVITDGAKQMNLTAFWRDEIPEGSNRTADKIPVTCGFTDLPEWIQSEQSVVVSGYGAFVVNNMPVNISPDMLNQNKILQVSLMGPAYETSFGAERFEWNPKTHTWSSIWARPDVSSTSMVPIYSKAGNMALINGYREPEGWEVLGLDWNTGKTTHQTIFGDVNFGNGAYAILQYLKTGELLFNSFSGPIRIQYT